jgi:CBS domain containing-hemolysin-like protein
MRILRPFGLQGVSGHETHSKKEIRALLSQAHAHGELTRTEHRLLDAVFDFSDTICRHIMLPRVKIEFVDVGQPREALLATIQRSMYTRYPVCDGSLDTVLGDMHIKDLFRVDFEAPELSLRTTLPPPPRVRARNHARQPATRLVSFHVKQCIAEIVRTQRSNRDLSLA